MDLSDMGLVDRSEAVTDGWYQNDVRCHTRGHARQWCCSTAQNDMRSAIVNALAEVRDAAVQAERERCIAMIQDYFDTEIEPWPAQLVAAIRGVPDAP